jgi:HEAT repeat protein
MQSQLIYQIGTIRDPAALPFLESFAVSKERSLRMWALQALRSIGSRHSAAVFLKELDDPDPDNGFSAMQGLLSLRPAGSATDWVPTWADFRRSPQYYAIKTRDWWRNL